MDDSRFMEEDKLPVYPWNDHTGSTEALGMLSLADLENALTPGFKTQLAGKIKERETDIGVIIGTMIGIGVVVFGGRWSEGVADWSDVDLACEDLGRVGP